MKRFLVAAIVLALSAPVAFAAGPRWLGTWGAPPVPPPATNARTFTNQTVRQVVRISAGGDRIRLRLTNEYGEKPLVVGAASVALAHPNGALTGAQIPVTFGGSPSITIPAGAPALSDPIDLKVAALASVSISLYFPEQTPACSCHPQGLQTLYVSPAGDFTAKTFDPASTAVVRAFLSGVQVETKAAGKTIITFGDSITDGTNSTVNSNNRWHDHLAQRLAARSPRQAWGVVNAAISGNRVLSTGNVVFGEAALKRFDRDVLSVPGAQYMVVLEGINDIGMGAATPPTAQQIIAGHKQIIARAKSHGLKVYGVTFLPYEGAAYFRPLGEPIRQEVNQWIRTSGAYDAVIDFDALMKDPANPTKLKANQQSGDWLHPNDAGYKAMGEFVDLKLFK